MSLVQLSCRRYQPGGVSRPLPWKVARRRSGSLMVAGVRGGFRGSGGVRRGGLLRSGTSTSFFVWSWVGFAGLDGVGWSQG